MVPARPLHERHDDAFERLKSGLDVRAGGRIVAADSGAFSSGFADLDRALGGGLPRGAVATLEGPPTCGRTALLASVLAQGTHLGLTALVDDGALYPPDLERAGVDLDRLVIAQAGNPLEIARSADILLRARTFTVVAMPAAPLRATVWSRLCGLALKAGAVVVVSAQQPSTELAYFASTRVRCAIERVVWSGECGVFGEVAGYEIQACVLKHRRSASGATAHLRIGSVA
jgi:hypothetical protein